ncbi:MAG: acetate kinase [Elusimicrobiota bacterium]|jgi:acetate kinase|nr:acetate kinase [Elusimicrobiota bacterium]
MIILCLNCGSSSVKYSLFDWENKRNIAVGLVERVGQPEAVISQEAPGKEKFEKTAPCPDFKTAIEWVLETLTDKEHGVIENMGIIGAVGHRVVHGGPLDKSTLITPEIITLLKSISDLAPLHNPANILGMEAAMHVMPNVQHIVTADTAWHQTMPSHTYMYALPYEWYEKYHIRRYGFHGTSFLYNAKRASVLLGKDPFDCNLIICHIGNGASVNAVKNGVSYDTSMGLTPLEGLVMGTRSGDFDASIAFQMMEKENISPKDMYNILNKKSGVLGITGKYQDRRDIELAAEKGDKRAELAIQMEAYRIKKYIGAYAAALGRVDAIVFTAGVGERGPLYRGLSLSNMEHLGIKCDAERNKSAMTKNAESLISTDDSKVKVFVIPTDEEIVYAEDVAAIVNGHYDIHTKFKYTFQDKNYRNSLRDESLKKELIKKPFLKNAIINTPKELLG